jgi:hypothetical protein
MVEVVEFDVGKCDDENDVSSLDAALILETLYPRSTTRQGLSAGFNPCSFAHHDEADAKC